jgi:hypothetical protein
MPNPAHQRAKLLRPTEKGREGIRRIAPAHSAFAEQLADQLGVDQFHGIVEKMTALSDALNRVAPRGWLLPSGQGSLGDARNAIRPGALAERPPRSPR